MGRLYDNILETIGHTPVVRINRLAPAHVNLYAKIEAFNPLGSVKDRLALGVIEAAEQSGALKPGQTVIEATSGNTGIGLAMVCAAKGYPLVVTMAESFSIERRRLMRFLGAKVVLTPAALRATGMVDKTVELAETHGWYYTRQFENEANPDMHSRTTAREIVDDFAGKRLDYWVTGYGTGGTLKGVARVLRRRAARHQDRRLRAGGRADADQRRGAGRATPTARPPPATRRGSRTRCRAGRPTSSPSSPATRWTRTCIDQLLTIAGPDALAGSRDLAAKEGIFVGITAGATFAGALKVAESAPAGANILCMLPDTGERYLSTPLFADVPVDMTEEEQAILKSSPMFA